MREYMGYVGQACKNGMTSDEIKYLFNDIYAKANSRKGKKILRLFARGIGKAKKNTLKIQTELNQQQTIQTELDQQQKGYQYQYYKQ